MIAVRATAAVMAAVAALALWKAWSLSAWGFDGPGPGFYPRLAAAAALALALAVVVFPGAPPKPSADDDAGQDGPLEPAERRSFLVYGAALVGLAAAIEPLGFSPAVALFVVVAVRYAEARSWAAALACAAVAVGVALVFFGWALRVDLPAGPVERLFFGLVR